MLDALRNTAAAFGEQCCTIVSQKNVLTTSIGDMMRLCLMCRRLAMITQAGVAIGLANNVAERVPDLGTDFSSLLMAVIVLNQLAGPPLLKHALLSIGEGKQSTNSMHKSPKPVQVDSTLGVRYSV